MVRIGRSLMRRGAGAGVVGDMMREDSWAGWRHDVDMVVEVEETEFGIGSIHVASGGVVGGSGGREVGKMGFAEMTLLRRRMPKR
jgi:hypothetical protein